MTLLRSLNQVCPLCGTLSQYREVLTTKSNGSGNLDGRKTEDRIRYWVRECPNCGYAASDFTKRLPFARLVRKYIASPEYLQCEGHDFSSHLARLFYRQYMICREEGSGSSALQAVRCCVWACDDADDTDGAYCCREIALELIQSELDCLNTEDPDDYDDSYELEESEMWTIVKIDLLRRNGHYADVLKLCDSFKPVTELKYESIRRFQHQLALDEDDNCYTVEEALRLFPTPKYRYCSVVIEGKEGKSFYYKTVSDKYITGDRVVVDFAGKIKPGRIIMIEDADDENAPYPPMQTKEIIMGYDELRQGADKMPAAKEYDSIRNIASSRKCETEIHKSDEKGYEYLNDGEILAVIKNPHGGQPVTVRCGDDYTISFWDWSRTYDYPKTSHYRGGKNSARNEIAAQNKLYLFDDLGKILDGWDCIAMVYVNGIYAGGEIMKPITVNRLTPKVLLPKILSDPQTIERALTEDTVIEVRHWMPYLDSTTGIRRGQKYNIKDPDIARDVPDDDI